MAAPTINPAKALRGPGLLLAGVLGSSDPTNTVTGSVFTDDWTTQTGWSSLGPTDAGSHFHDTITTENVDVAESYYPIEIVTTAREASIDFALAEFTATRLKTMLNGATLATGGSGATLLTTVTPGIIGSEVRTMLGWQSLDNTVRLVAYQALQVGNIEPEFRKGAQKALLTGTFRFEQSSAGYAYRWFFAGATRG